MIPATTIALIILFIILFSFVHYLAHGGLALIGQNQQTHSENTPNLQMPSEPIIKRVVEEKTNIVVLGNPIFARIDPDHPDKIVAIYERCEEVILDGNKCFFIPVPSFVIQKMRESGDPPHIENLLNNTKKSNTNNQDKKQTDDHKDGYWVTKRIIIEQFKWRNEGKTNQITDALFRNHIQIKIPPEGIKKEAVTVNGQKCHLYLVSELSAIGVTPMGKFDKYEKQGEAYNLIENTPKHT